MKKLVVFGLLLISLSQTSNTEEAVRGRACASNPILNNGMCMLVQEIGELRFYTCDSIEGFVTNADCFGVYTTPNPLDGEE